MNKVELNIMKGMVSILNEASEAYYNTGHPIMTDEQFDMRLADLKQFEEETGFVLANSPTHNVGAKVLTELKEVEHNHPMLSLEKCHTVEEIIKFANNKPLVASIKLDGLTVSIKYVDGVLVSAETRGNGYVGSDVTEHIKQFINVPMKIDKEGTYIVDGEAIITNEDFAEVNKDGEYKNSRNLASGTLSVLDTSLVAKRKLRFYVWDVIEGGGVSLKDNLIAAQELGFDIVPYWSVLGFNPKNTQATFDYIFDYAQEEGLPTDGIVFKFEDVEYGKSLGATSHHFKNGIAYKNKNEEVETVLRDIDWTLGKTGVITPTAVFDAVEIYDTTVERASLHNISIMKELLGEEPHIGQNIVVTKSNMIIPQVVRADKRYSGIQDLMLDIPTVCPICGGKTEIKQDNDSKVLTCTNDNCKGKLLGKLSHFVSKNAMNIDGLSDATLEKLIELGWVKSFRDIYKLDYLRLNLKELDGFGDKSVDKLLEAIEVSRNTTLDKFIYALSITDVGRSTAKTIASRFKDYKDFIVRAPHFNWEELDGIGAQTALKISEFIQKHIDEIREISNELNFEDVEYFCSNTLADKTFVITGSLNHFANRDEAIKKIESFGGKVSGSISAKTSYLVNNDVNSNSSKNKKAKNFNIPIISESELIEMLK